MGCLLALTPAAVRVGRLPAGRTAVEDIRVGHTAVVDILAGRTAVVDIRVVHTAVVDILGMYRAVPVEEGVVAVGRAEGRDGRVVLWGTELVALHKEPTVLFQPFFD